MKETIPLLLVLTLSIGWEVANADFFFGEPVNLGPPFNTSSGEVNLFISADGLELYISSDRSGGLGYFDMWRTTRENADNPWRLLVNTPSVLNPAKGPFSVLAWIRGGEPGQVILSQIDGANWLCTDPMVCCLMTELKGAGRDSETLCSDMIVTDGSWRRIALVCDGDDRSLYVDDILVAQDIQTGGPPSCSGGLNIGCGIDMAPNTFFSGLIDDVRIYNRAVKP